MSAQGTTPKCIEANPEIVELKFGCEIFRTGATKREFFVGQFADQMSIVRIDKMGAWLPTIMSKPPNSQQYTVVGRPIRLADVLLAMGETDWHVGTNGRFFAWSRNLGEMIGQPVSWNLRKDDLNEQSEETINFLASLLR